MTKQPIQPEVHIQANLEEHFQLLYVQAVDAHETEQNQIAAYLNDTVVQTLSALHIQLSLLSHQSPETMASHLADALVSIVDLVDDVTQMSRSLHPLELDIAGLDSALQQASEEFSKLAGVMVHFQSTELPPLSAASRLAFYRCLQEGFTNILKHAQAIEVWVSLAGDETAVHLTIQDNGQGFAAAEEITTLHDAPGLGLLALMVRFRRLNGRLAIQSTVGEGTLVTAVLPIVS